MRNNVDIMAPEQLCVQVSYLSKPASEYLRLPSPLDSKYYWAFPQYASIVVLRITWKPHWKSGTRSGRWDFPLRSFSFLILPCTKPSPRTRKVLGLCVERADEDPVHRNGWHGHPWQPLGHCWRAPADPTLCIWISAKCKPSLCWPFSAAGWCQST